MSNTCLICFEDLIDKSTASPDVCDHVFCLPCLETWSKHGSFCPIDRKRFKKIKVLNSETVIQIKPRRQKRKRVLYDVSTYCEVCKDENNGDRLLLCDCCDLGYHCLCLTPPLKKVPSGVWYCPVCVAVEKKMKTKKGHTKELDYIVQDHMNWEELPVEETSDEPSISSPHLARSLRSKKITITHERQSDRTKRGRRKFTSSSITKISNCLQEESSHSSNEGTENAYIPYRHAKVTRSKNFHANNTTACEGTSFGVEYNDNDSEMEDFDLLDSQLDDENKKTLEQQEDHIVNSKSAAEEGSSFEVEGDNFDSEIEGLKLSGPFLPSCSYGENEKNFEEEHGNNTVHVNLENMDGTSKCQSKAIQEELPLQFVSPLENDIPSDDEDSLDKLISSSTVMDDAFDTISKSNSTEYSTSSPFSVFEKLDDAFTSSQRYSSMNMAVNKTNHSSQNSLPILSRNFNTLSDSNLIPQERHLFSKKLRQRHNPYSLPRNTHSSSLDISSQVAQDSELDCNSVYNCDARQVQYAIKARLNLSNELQKIEREKWKKTFNSCSAKRNSNEPLSQKTHQYKLPAPEKSFPNASSVTASKQYKSKSMATLLEEVRSRKTKPNDLVISRSKVRVSSTKLFLKTEYNLFPHKTMEGNPEQFIPSHLLGNALFLHDLKLLKMRKDGTLFLDWVKSSSKSSTV